MDERHENHDEPASSEAVGTIDESDAPQSEQSASVLTRRGDVQKCPVCGSHVDPEAYHCPKCRNYFCYQCRARLVPPDTQLQCVNQDCDYYGKLVCDVCDVAHEQDESPSVYAEPEDGYWPAWLLLALIAFGTTWYFSSWKVASMTAIGIFVVLGLMLQRFGLNIFGRNRVVSHQRKSVFHSCISCGERVKEIRKSK